MVIYSNHTLGQDGHLQYSTHTLGQNVIYSTTHMLLHTIFHLYTFHFLIFYLNNVKRS
jgi:hypothetical protein